MLNKPLEKDAEVGRIPSFVITLQMSPCNLSIFVEGIFESTCVEVYTSRSSVIVGIIYCPVGVRDNVLNIISTLLDSLNNENKNYLLMGNFNCNNLNEGENSQLYSIY